MLEGQAEDLAFVNLLAHEERQGEQVSYPNLLAFSGQTPALERDGTAVVVNTLNDHPMLGTLGLLNCHRIVYPLSSGGPEGDHWSLDNWSGQCHRKGGLVVWCPSFAGTGQMEASANIIAGNIDALEWAHGYLAEWDFFLNAARRLPLAGGSGKVSNLEILGSPRTYARLRAGEEAGYKNWIEAIRRGQTFATCGPLLSFSVNQQDVGSTVTLRSADKKLHVRLQRVNPGCGDETDLVIIANGAPVARKSIAATDATLEVELPLPLGGWVAGCCWDVATRRLLAQTSPIYVRVEGQATYMNREAVQLLDSGLESNLRWVAQASRCPTDHQREHFREIFARAGVFLQESVSSQVAAPTRPHRRRPHGSIGIREPSCFAASGRCCLAGPRSSLPGTYGYTTIEGWSFFDALYMTVTDASRPSAIGEVHPLSSIGRSFTIVLLLVGVFTFFYTVTELVRSVISGELQAALRESAHGTQPGGDRRHHMIICGYGRMGGTSAEEFPSGRSAVRHHRSPAGFARRVRHGGGIALEGDATSDEVLKCGSASSAAARLVTRGRLRRRKPVHHPERPASQRQAVHRGRAEGELAEQKLRPPAPAASSRPTPSAAAKVARPCCGRPSWTSSSWPRGRSISNCRSRKRESRGQQVGRHHAAAISRLRQESASSSSPSRRPPATSSPIRPATPSWNPATRSSPWATGNSWINWKS